MSSMIFCSQCDSLMDPKENFVQHTLAFECPKCLNVDESESPVIYENNVGQSSVEKLTVTMNITKDPTLPRTANAGFNCKTCDSTSFVFFQSPKTARDTAMTLFFVCTECGTRFQK